MLMSKDRYNVYQEGALAVGFDLCNFGALSLKDEPSR